MADHELDMTSLSSLVETAVKYNSAENTRITRGSLIVAGCGLSGVDGLPELEDLVRTADTVIFCVGNKIARAWLLARRPDGVDLGILYGDGSRSTTYIQMTEVILAAPRAGRSTLAIFYGHPGFFCAPGRWAIEKAKADGIPAIMYPGLSTLDYLVADLGFDPAQPGMQVLEATILLNRKLRPDPNLHAVILQAGAVGFAGGADIKPVPTYLTKLQKLLVEVYGSDGLAIHYIKSFTSAIDSIVQPFKVSELTSDAVVSRLSSASTIYIPPGAQITSEYNYSIFSKDDIETSLRQTANIQLVQDNRSSAGLSPVMRFFYALAVRPSLSALFRIDPDRVIDDPLFADLSTKLKSILRRNDWEAVRRLIWKRSR